MSKVTSSTLKKCWLMRFTKLQIDSGGPSTSETPQEEKTIRNRSGVFRSLRKMRKRVKSCITHNKLGDSTKEETLLSYVSTLKKITKARNQMSQLSAEPTPRNVLTQEVSNLSTCCWYWGPLSRREAEKKLRDLPDGSFLIRDSVSSLHVFSISFRALGLTFHSHVLHVSEGYSLNKQICFPTITKLIENAMARSEDSVYCYMINNRDNMLPTLPVRLLHPVSRFTQVKSLKYLCRFVIRQKTNINNISSLPIPVSVQNYLQQGQY